MQQRYDLQDGVPCEHRGCLNHTHHPCEGCGRIAGRRIMFYTDHLAEVKRRLFQQVGFILDGDPEKDALVTTNLLAEIAKKDEEIAALKGENQRLELRTEQAIQLYMMHKNKTQVQLRKEIAALQESRDYWKQQWGYMEAAQKQGEARIKELEGALDAILHEVGIPQPGYMQPVVNVYEIAKAALRVKSDER